MHNTGTKQYSMLYSPTSLPNLLPLLQYPALLFSFSRTAISTANVVMMEWSGIYLFSLLELCHLPVFYFTLNDVCTHIYIHTAAQTHLI